MCVCGLRGGVGVFWGEEVKSTKTTACFLFVCWEEVRAVYCISLATVKNGFAHQSSSDVTASSCSYFESCLKSYFFNKCIYVGTQIAMQVQRLTHLEKAV